MGGSNISEEYSDWEEIQYQYNEQPSSSSPRGQRLDKEVVIMDNFYNDGSSVFPPREHEGLPIVLEECESTKNAFSYRSPLPLPGSGKDPPHQHQIEVESKLSVVMGRIKVRMCTTWGKMSAFVASGYRSCPSPLIVPATALAVALFACVKILLWRKRVSLLMREKDKRISQLLHQIAHMNQILSAKRRVPVLRIN